MSCWSVVFREDHCKSFALVNVQLSHNFKSQASWAYSDSWLAAALSSARVDPGLVLVDADAAGGPCDLQQFRLPTLNKLQITMPNYCGARYLHNDPVIALPTRAWPAIHYASCALLYCTRTYRVLLWDVRATTQIDIHSSELAYTIVLECCKNFSSHPRPVPILPSAWPPPSQSWSPLPFFVSRVLKSQSNHHM